LKLQYRPDGTVISFLWCCLDGYVATAFFKNVYLSMKNYFEIIHS